MENNLLLFAILVAFAFSGCKSSKPEDIAYPPVRIYNTHGSADSAQWTRVVGLSDTLDPNQIIVENGLIRLTYPCNLGRNGKDSQKFDQKAGNLVYLKLNGEYKLAQNEDYGDWIYVDDSMIDTLTGFKITKNTDSIVEFKMFFDHHYAYGGNQLKFDPNSENPVVKTVTLCRGHYGYLIHVDLKRNLPGEREAGFGMAEKPTFYYNPETGHQRPDNKTTYLYLRQVGEMKNFWGVGIAPQKEFYRFVSVSPEFPHAIRSAQWHEGQIGAFYRWTLEGLAYEAYIAVVPYNASAARDITITDHMATVNVPADGIYSIFSKKDQLYELILKDIRLNKGKNSVKLPNNVNPEDAIIVPITSGKDFPEDIYAEYQKLLKQL